MKLAEDFAQLVLNIPETAKSNPKWHGWEELRKSAYDIKNFDRQADCELIIPESISMRDIFLDFRIAVMTKTIEAGIDAIEMLESQKEKGEIILVLFHPMSIHGLSTLSLTVISTLTQLVDLITAGYVMAPK